MKRAGLNRISGTYKRPLLKLVVACGVIFAVWWMIANFIDDPLWRLWKSRKPPTWVKDTFLFFRFLFIRPIPFILLIWACLVGGPRSERWRLVAQVVMTIVIVSIPIWCGKLLVPRYRPRSFEGLNWAESFVFKPMHWHGTELQSVVSGDAALAFAVSVVLAFHFPRFRAILYILAVGCACGRFIQHAHWPSDIFLGAVIGYIVGRMVLVITGDVRTGT